MYSTILIMMGMQKIAKFAAFTIMMMVIGIWIKGFSVIKPNGKKYRMAKGKEKKINKIMKNAHNAVTDKTYKII